MHQEQEDGRCPVSTESGRVARVDDTRDRRVAVLVPEGVSLSARAGTRKKGSAEGAEDGPSGSEMEEFETQTHDKGRHPTSRV